MRKIAIIGGDNRFKILREKLISDGFSVASLGLLKNDGEDIETADTLIFPVPTTKDKVTVFAPLTDRKIYLSEMEKFSKNKKLVISYNYTFSGEKNVDLEKSDAYALLNSVPTAEGAIKIAIENTDFTLWKSKVLVIGYGRVGKVLANRLLSLGAFVTIAARKEYDFSLSETFGLDYINTESLNHTNLDYDIIFNTVDIKVIDDKTLEKLNCSLLLDLSTFGGFSLEKANGLGLRAIKAPSLPVKTAPKTAAEILYKTVRKILT